MHLFDPARHISLRAKAVPLYYASQCGFRGLVEHLIAIHSQNVNTKGGSHRTRYMLP
jgi:hypothetical protein